jgi:sortase A
MPTNQQPYNSQQPGSAGGLRPSNTEPVLKPASDDMSTDGPLFTSDQADDRSQAVSLIRQKLAAIYGGEPDARQELAEAELPKIRHSKHQQYMLSLQQSGISMAEIQAQWHAYYQNLGDLEKREVWQEFYDQSAQAKTAMTSGGPAAAADSRPVTTYPLEQAQSAMPQEAMEGIATAARPMAAQSLSAIYPTPTTGPGAAPPTSHKPHTPSATTQAIARSFSKQPGAAASASNDFENLFERHQLTYEAPDTQQPTARAYASIPTAEQAPRHPSLEQSPQALKQFKPPSVLIRQPSELRRTIKDKVSNRRKLQAKHHLKSLGFGLSIGVLTLFIVMFSFFNQVIIAPFIQPSRKVSATPIIVNPGGATPSKQDEVIIPKINVEIPLVFEESSDAAAFEAALDHGVTHYPTTAKPGEKGNASFFGHSSNNIFNPGKFKFAFVLLNELVPGDTFYINYKGVSYAYQVYDKKIVEPSQVDILNPVPDKVATAMLVTCDPPGTSLHRLAVWGEQVAPNPNGNIAQTTADKSTPASSALPGNGKSLWNRFWGWISGN